MPPTDVHVREERGIRFGGSASLAWWVRIAAFWIGFVIVLAAVLVVLGAGARDSFILAVGVAVQTSAGTAVWDVVRRRKATGVELLGMGLVLGPVLAVLIGVAGNIVVRWDWWWLLAVPVAWGLWWFRRSAGALERTDVDSDAPRWGRPWVVLSTGFVVGLVLLTLNLRRYPLNPQGLWDGYHPDQVFFEALGYSTAIFGPTDSIFMAGADIRYHWLTYAWAGQLSESVAAQPFMTLTRVLPLVALASLVALAIALTDRVARTLPDTHRYAARWLAVGLVVSGGYLGAVNGTILNFDSPSQALTAAWLMALVLAVLYAATAARRDVDLIGTFVVVAVLAFALTGGKVSAGVVGLVGVAGAGAVGLLMRAPWRWRMAALAAVVVVMVGVAGLLFAWGSASPGDLRFLAWNGRASTIQGLNSSPANRGVALGTLTLVVAMGARWVGGTWLLASREWRERLEPWLGVGLVLAAVLPVVFFAQGVNETWFALTASGPLAVLAAVGVAVAWLRVGLGRAAVVWSAIAGVLALAGTSYIWTDQVWESGFGRFWGPWLSIGVAAVAGLVWAAIRRQRALATALAVATLTVTVAAAGARATPFIGALVGGARDGAGVRTAELAEPGLTGVSEVAVGEPAGEGRDDPGTVLQEPGPVDQGEGSRPDHAWSPDHLAAAEFLRERADRDEVVATNDVNSFLVPALTRLRTYISGVPYQSLYGGAATVGGIPERVDVVTGVFDGSRSVSELCDAGVTWLWVAQDRPMSIDAASLGTVEFANDAVTIVRLSAEACAS